MGYRITVLPHKQNISADAGENLLAVLRAAHLAPDAPCGGNGTCGKCRVLVDGLEVLACRTAVDRDMTVTIPDRGDAAILTAGMAVPGGAGCVLAFDIGTTTVAGFLLYDDMEFAESRLNPQADFGADVISRISYALKGHMDDLTGSIRRCMEEMIHDLCVRAGISPSHIETLSIVGNPAMRQLFLGISPENLAEIPFAPVLSRFNLLPAREYLPMLKRANLLIIPDISGFVGSDTVACVLASGMDKSEELTLLVDIGTNGEMVLGNKDRFIACSTAAGPALEGANISCGMRGQTGAIDHVWLENGEFRCSVIGGGDARGICGSGLIDAAACALELGLLNSRGRILNEDHTIRLTDDISLTQEDIRQLQAAKGAIAAGIMLMAYTANFALEEISRVYLAGAFGTYMDPRSACRIGLLPPILENKITPIGNAAGSGAKRLALRREERFHAEYILARTSFLELASQPGFARCFAHNMRF